MDQDNDVSVEIPEVADLPAVEEGQEDTTDYKALAQQQQETLKKMQGMAKRFQTKVKKLSEQKPPEAPKPAEVPVPEKKGFDYAEKAYLKASGIEADDFEFIQQVMKDTGKDIDGVLSSKYFQAELKERKEVRMTEAATPSGSKRTATPTRDQVDYWLAKGELPKDNPELARKVVAAKIAKEKQGSFSDNPVVTGVQTK